MTPWSLETEARRRRTWRGLGAAALSVVLPGLGHLSLGWRRRGWLLVVVGLSVAAAGAWAAGNTGPVVAWLIRPDTLPWLLSGNLALLVFRLGAAVDAYRLGARPRAIPALPRGAVAIVGTVGAVTGLLIVVAAPHALVAYATVRTAEVVDAVFVVDEAPPPPLPAGPPSQDAEEQPPPPAPVERPEPPALEDLPRVPDNPWLADERLTVAVLGSDAGPGRSGSRLDAILVGSLDTVTGRTVVVSIDRYLADFPLPDHLAELYADNCPDGEGWRYLNAFYTCGLERIDEELGELYPDSVDPAASAVTDTLAALLDLPIDHYAVVDMAGFVGMVDALGGVELELSQDVTVRMSPASDDAEWRTYSLESGRQVLTGEEAMAYVRLRGAGGDRVRMDRQRCFVAGALASADAPSLLRGFPAIADAVEQHVATDVPVAGLPALVQLLLQVDLGPVAGQGFGPPDFRGPDHVPDVEAIRARTAELLDGEVEDADLEVVDGVACP
ncbi:MAG: LytR family transcriptional regulator [Nitriliruptor sp.]|nr:MAG: LytR family transcriptional regulator [Nitriliruptor sp.]